MNIGGSSKEKQEIGHVTIEEANRRISQMVSREADQMLKQWIKSGEDEKLKALLKTIELREDELRKYMRMEDQFRRAILVAIPIIDTASGDRLNPTGIKRLAELNPYLRKVLEHNRHEDDEEKNQSN